MDLPEFVRAVRVTGRVASEGVSDAELAELFRAVDQDDSGGVSIAEFERFLEQSHTTARQQLQERAASARPWVSGQRQPGSAVQRSAGVSRSTTAASLLGHHHQHTALTRSTTGACLPARSTANASARSQGSLPRSHTHGSLWAQARGSREFLALNGGSATSTGALAQLSPQLLEDVKKRFMAAAYGPGGADVARLFRRLHRCLTAAARTLLPRRRTGARAVVQWLE